MKKVISLVLSILSSMIISTAYYMLITKISPTIANDYKNVQIFFQDVNPRDIIYIINPAIIGLSTFLLWIISKQFCINKNINAILSICLFSLIYASIVLPILLFNYASLKISFCVVFGWFIQFLLQSFVAGTIYNLLKIK